MVLRLPGNIASVLGTTLVFAMCCSFALAETVTFSAELSGANEVPPNDSAASGLATVTFDTDTRMLSWSITYEEMSGPVIGSHIHGPAGEGVNAGILVGLEPDLSPMEGSVEINDEQAGHILNGETYINLHTEKYPSGELRGQLLR